jgi:outer membrane protein assembly factor BamB
MHPDTGYSTPTPVSDGRFVYAVYGTGVAACFDLDGGRRWVRQIGKPSASCGQVASPLLIGGKVIVHFAHPTEKWPDDKKFLGGIPGRLPCLTALNADTGAVVWRATVGAGAGTAVSLRLGADDILATPAGDIVRAADGRLLASGSLLVQYNSPAVEGRTLYFVDPQHDRRCTAMRLPGMIAEPLMPEVLWKNDIRKTRGFSTPLCHEGVVYAVGENSILTALDADTGERLYEQTISGDGAPFTSVVRAGATLFAGRQNGVLVAFKPGRKYEEAGRFSLGALRSTPFFRGNRMYVRTLEHVYCIERTAPPAPESAVAGNAGTGRDP